MNKLGRLSGVEMEIMQTIWGLSTKDAGVNSEHIERQTLITVAQLLAIFKESKGWKTPTIATMLERIITKGFLNKEMKGKAYYYSITATFEDYQRQEGQNILASLYGGSVKNFISALAEGGNMTAADVKELQEWFANNVRKDGDIK